MELFLKSTGPMRHWPWLPNVIRGTGLEVVVGGGGGGVCCLLLVFVVVVIVVCCFNLPPVWVLFSDT